MHNLGSFEDRLEANALFADETFEAIPLSAVANAADGLDVFWLEACLITLDKEKAGIR